MATKVYIAINGTCTAEPDEDLFQIMAEIGSGKRERKFDKKLEREVTGGGTALWISSQSRTYMIDTGDSLDRRILESSIDEISKIEKRDAVAGVRAIYPTHAHPDHIANNDLFPEAYWLIDSRDESFRYMFEREDTMENMEYHKGFRQYFKEQRDNGITLDMFCFYGNNQHAGKPSGLTILDTPGHEVMHKAFVIRDDDIIVRNIETGEESTTTKVVFAGDVFCNKAYLERFLSPDPERQRTAIYANAIPTGQWGICEHDQQVRDRMDEQNLRSMRTLLKEAQDSVMIFGHGGAYRIR